MQWPWRHVTFCAPSGVRCKRLSGRRFREGMARAQFFHDFSRAAADSQKVHRSPPIVGVSGGRSDSEILDVQKIVFLRAVESPQLTPDQEGGRPKDDALSAYEHPELEVQEKRTATVPQPTNADPRISPRKVLCFAGIEISKPSEPCRLLNVREAPLIGLRSASGN